MNTPTHIPRYTLLENGTLLLAIIVLGIMAGLFWTYTFNVNYATLELDGASYARVQSLLNVNVRHPMFFVFFFGGGAFTVLALLVNIRHWRSGHFYLLAAACLIYTFGVIVFTQMVNLPLNAYTESWNPNQLPDDWQQVREQWNTANAIRVITAGSAFILAAVVLMIRAGSAPKRVPSE